MPGVETAVGSGPRRSRDGTTRDSQLLGPRPRGPPRLHLPDQYPDHSVPPAGGHRPFHWAGTCTCGTKLRALDGKGAAGPDRVILLPHPRASRVLCRAPFPRRPYR